MKNLLKADQGNSVYSVLPARRYFASLNMTTHAISVFATSLMSLLSLLSLGAGYGFSPCGAGIYPRDIRDDRDLRDIRDDSINRKCHVERQ